MTHCDGSLDAIDDIPVPLSDPEFESPLAWEIMWSDPVSSNYQFSEEEESEIKNNNGFVFNSRRGLYIYRPRLCSGIKYSLDSRQRLSSSLPDSTPS